MKPKNLIQESWRMIHLLVVISLLSFGSALFGWTNTRVLAQAGEVTNPANLATLAAGTNVLLDFNNFANPVDGRVIPVGTAGVTWNSLIEGSPWAGISTWNFYIFNGESRGSITFPRPVIVMSVLVSSHATNIFTLISPGNPNVSITTQKNNPRVLVTGWTQAVTSLTIQSSSSDQALDDLRLTMSGGSQTLTPAVTFTTSPSTTRTPTRTSTITSPVLTQTSTRTPTITSPVPTQISTRTPSTPTGSIIANSSIINQFEQIPSTAIQNASHKKVLFVHLSTGERVSIQGLDYLQGTSNRPSPYAPYVYDRRNWIWPFFNTADFPAKVNEFRNIVNSQQQNFDVFGMKFCYLDWWDSDFATYRDMMLQVESAYPGKVFIWTTQALYANWSNGAVANQGQIIQTFNNEVRAYALANNKPLFDLANIESTDPNGNPCYTQVETMCVQYLEAGEPESGHPNNEGATRLAKGFWWLMARLSGWNGN